MIKPQTLKGFRDFLPVEARKRQFVTNKLTEVFENYGFERLETPTLEYEEILSGKYGEEGDKLMYRFEDNGARRVAMRYDQTVPLARVVAQYQNELPMPFKRYQIQNVWRADKPQRGRYREFLQCDADVVGSSSPVADANVILTAAAGLVNLGFKSLTVMINDRGVFGDLPVSAIIAIDKLKKIGVEGVQRELVQRNVCDTLEQAEKLITDLQTSKPTERLTEILKIIEASKPGVFDDVTFAFTPTLARGLDYYTSTIFEIELTGYTVGSVCGGGRYDTLIGMFAGRPIPAVGFAFGFDRIVDAMHDLGMFGQDALVSATSVLVTIFSEEQYANAFEIANKLRQHGISEEVYPGEKGAKMDKQLKYANQKNIPNVIIAGPEEIASGFVTWKNMRTREQKQLTISELIAQLK